MIESSHVEDDLYAIISHFDEPFAGVISAYFLARRIARHVKVAVSGDGADELFGSYLSHRLAEPIAAPAQPALDRVGPILSGYIRQLLLQRADCALLR